MTAPVILVPLDGTEQALAALPVAQGLAAAEGAVVHVLHVARRAMPADELLQELRLDPEDLEGSVLDTRLGEPAEAILQAAAERQSAPLVMCTHTGFAAPEDILGTTAERVLRGSSGPVVFVPRDRGRRPWALRTLLVPHDGAPSTSEIIGTVMDLARRADARLWILHLAGPDTPDPTEVGSLAAPHYLDHPQHEWPAWASEFLDRALGWRPHPDLSLRLAFARGKTAETIVRFARDREIDLIVLAWHGAWRDGHALSVKAVLKESPAPVMVARVKTPG
jgi:nucleotide-binding universal stress UspA family protein